MQLFDRYEELPTETKLDLLLGFVLVLAAVVLFFAVSVMFLL